MHKTPKNRKRNEFEKEKNEEKKIFFQGKKSYIITQLDPKKNHNNIIFRLNLRRKTLRRPHHFFNDLR